MVPGMILQSGTLKLESTTLDEHSGLANVSLVALAEFVDRKVSMIIRNLDSYFASETQITF